MMRRVERLNHLKRKNKKKVFQLAFMALLLVICIAFLYFFNLMPFSSDILAHERLNILAVGTDSIESSGRADTILVLSVSPKTKDTVLFSIPRDMRVMIPGKGEDKINHSFAYGGIELLEKTVENFMGLSIHYFGVIDFESFKLIIDALGGVQLNVEKDMYYVDQAGSLQINLHSGLQLLDGESALEYVRFRFDSLGDLGRIQRQQKLINAVIEKMMSFDSMMKIPSIVGNLSEYIHTNMNANEMIALLKLMKDVDREKIWIETIYGEPQYIDGVSYLVPDDEEVKSKARYLIENKNRGLNVEVLNGNKMPGIAHRVANQLEEIGFNVVNIDNADHFDYQKTVLVIYSKEIRVDDYLKQFLNDVEVIRKEDPEKTVDMTVIIGKNMLY
ncbi:MAG: LCP family protein [Candidatus Atribacteria bacterium]|nr:LCP family protein [Candidatus Atribacteria bacterium]